MAAMTSRGLTGFSVSLICLIRARARSPNWAARVLHGGQHELFLGAEVVLHQPQGHAGLGRDLAHPGGVQPARGSRPQQRAGDLPPPLLVINPLRHPLTVPLARRPIL